jgi:hypothetical protein
LTDTTTHLALPLLAQGQAQKEVWHNEALAMLDAVVQLSVKDRDLASPPGSPAEGDRYIVAGGASGAWAGHASHVAAWLNGAWNFFPPKEGWIAWVAGEDTLLTFGPSGWTDFGGALGAIQNLALLGVGTTADAVNPFSAKLNKALWTAKTAGEGGDGDLRYTMNKETTADILSILLQSGFSGRAEIGLIGNDDVTIKVSPDGSSWLNAVTIDKADGSVALAGSLAVDTSLLVVDAANARILSGLSAAKANLRYFNGAQSTPAVQRFGTSIASSAMALVHENNSAGNNPTFYFARGRTGGAAAGSSDTLGAIGFNAHDGAADYYMAAMIRAIVDGQANSAGNVNALLAFYTNPGGTTPVERMRIDRDGNIGMGGANIVIDSSRHFRLRAYTIATLPPASAGAGQVIYCSDLGGGGGELVSDGVSWKRTNPSGMAEVTSTSTFTLTTLVDTPTIRHTATLAADRTVTLSSTNAYNGARFHIARTGGGVGLLSVGGLHMLSGGRWCIVEHDGSAWRLIGAGSLS